MTSNPFVIETELTREPGDSRHVDVTVTLEEKLGTDVIAVPAGDVVELSLLLESVMDGVLVTGSVSGIVQGECVRCLKPLSEPFDVQITELFAYPETLEDQPQGEDDEPTPVVEEGAVDLTEAVVDAVVLELPFNPVCESDCPGLCSQCGFDMSQDPDHTHEAPIDPRWAALSKLVGDDDRS